MHFLLASILIQILCAVHCVRGGRNQMWLMVIIFLSIPGCIAYVIFEILPDLTGRREVRAVKAAAVKALDPEREVRRAREALDLADTAANHGALADALAAQGKWNEAVSHYEQVERKAVRGDRALSLKLAKACFEAGRSERARQLLEGLPESASPSENDRARLLLARLLEEDGEKQRALAIYADVGRRLPGAEAQCRQAALLIALGRRTDAMAPLAETEKRAKRIDRHERSRDGAMYDWAARTLAELRSDGGQAGG